MSVYGKFPRLRWFAPMLLVPVILSAGTGQPVADGFQTTPTAQAEAAVPAPPAEVAPELVSTSAETSRAAVPFCPSGEKRVCSLGPPPVCWCE